MLQMSMERDKQRRRALMSELDQITSAASKKACAETLDRKDRLKDQEMLWSGTLTKVNPNLQGHLFFRGAKIGQRVEVLEENVTGEGIGPGDRYLTVADRTIGALGLYPAAWVSPSVA